MKEITLCFLLIWLPWPILAQKQVSDSTITKISESPNDDLIRQRLVSIALQNSDKKIVDLQAKIAKDHIGIAKAAWLNTMFASSNWNEFTINPTSKGQYNLYYPKYNVGITVPLGIFITVPKNVKIARTQYRVAEEQEKLKVLSIKNEVLTRYEDFLMFKKQLTIQSIITDNEYTAFSQAERKFRSGQIDVDTYNLETKKYNEELSKKITLEHDLAVSKIDLEEIIGTNLETVIQNK